MLTHDPLLGSARGPAVLLIVLGCCASGLVAQQQGDTDSAEDPNRGLRLEWTVPADFPTEIETVVSGRLLGSGDKTPDVVRFRRGELAGHAAQRDAVSGRYLWFATAREQVRGKKVEVPVTFDNGTEKTPKDAQGSGDLSRVSIHDRGDRFEFRDGKRTVMFYQRSPKSLDGTSRRANYVHPLFDLDGSVVTQDFPADHIHHRGIFWAWHQIFVGQKRAGDSWVNQDLLSVVREVKIIEQGPVFATLEVVVDWQSMRLTDSAGKPRPVVDETTRIRLFHATPSHQYVDFRVTLGPLAEDVRIGGAENERGYSGFTARLRPPREIVITDENGRQKEDAVGTNSRWADVSGRFAETGRDVSGVAILSHPSLAEFPPKWLLRHYGMQNVVYPGRHAVPLSAKQPLVLRHRLVLHQGDAEDVSVAKHQRAYEHLP